jgi:linker between RRM2 and RRM3 domains in RBM39 protein
MSRLAGGSAGGVPGVPGMMGGTGANMLPLGGGVPGVPAYVAPAQPTGPVLSAPAQALQLEQGVLGPSSPIPTPCLLIKNMFDPAEYAPSPRAFILQRFTRIRSLTCKG